MSTLDVVAYAGEQYGGMKPANFLDIGGGASAEVMAAGLDIILGDPDVRSVFVNVFGGITSCDAVANGIVEALKILGDDAAKPLVVRLDGNNVDEGRRILAEANHPLVTVVDTMDDAAAKAAELAAAGGLSMSIFLNENSKVIVQGITGSEGMKHATKMLASGTQDRRRRQRPQGRDDRRDRRARTCRSSARVAEAMKETGADVTVLFVPPKFAKDAVIEAIDAGIGLAVVITEGIPVHDSAYVLGARVRQRQHARGSSARTARASSAPASPTPASSRRTSPAPARSGLVSKSGTLTYQMMYELRDIGFSTAIGIGGDPVIGTTHIDALEAFEADPETEAIVMIGEIGGDAEERAADYIEGQRHQAGRRLRRGVHRARGQDDGPRRRHRLRLRGDRAGQEGGARGRRRQGGQDALRDRRPRALAGQPGLTHPARPPAPPLTSSSREDTS